MLQSFTYMQHVFLMLHVFRVPVFAEKKPKTFSTVFGFVRPRPPKAQSWQAQQQTALQDVAFFSQLVALMSAAASTLNLGGRGANSSISKMVVAFILQTPE